MRNKLCHLMVIFVMLKWYKLLYYKEILSIYWMTLVALTFLSFNNRQSKLQPITQSVMHQLFSTTTPIVSKFRNVPDVPWICMDFDSLKNSQRNNIEYSNSVIIKVMLSWSINYTCIIPGKVFHFVSNYQNSI